MTAFKFDNDDEWEDGEIYDPEKGKTYSAYVNLKDKDSLSLSAGLYWLLTLWTQPNLDKKLLKKATPIIVIGMGHLLHRLFGRFLILSIYAITVIL